MNRERNDILDRLPRTDGMTVPEGYFDTFAASMMDRLPAKHAEKAPQKRTLWMKIHPYAYMAAMFGGIWLMMWMFGDIAGTTSYKRMADNPTIARVLASDQVYQYYDTDIDQYDLLEELYEDGYTPASFHIDDQYN
ncbi:hypothetical protein [Muribaculum intestinale]|uniref:hypothetical protein n=1 Tax=Muribaculum intestinale TaxID=1796646 RepID=UPI0025B025D2|nr:hypothetical protein [Muribaculum intestinale]